MKTSCVFLAIALVLVALAYSHVKPVFTDNAINDDSLPVFVEQECHQATAIAYAIWREARGESVEGKMAVASVIFNRGKGDPQKMVEAVTSKSWTGAKVFDPTNAPWEDSVFNRECWDIAMSMVRGEFRPISSWTNFYNPEMCNPAWSNNLELRTRVGGHVFGRLP